MNSGRKYSLLEAKTKLEALCAYQERCSQELDRKMQTWGLHPEDRDALLAVIKKFIYIRSYKHANI